MMSGSTRPSINSVFDLASASPDRCTPGGIVVLTGSGFGSWNDVPLDMGIYLHCSHGQHLHRIDEYESWRDGEIRARWPRWLVGSFRLFVETRAKCDTIVSAVHAVPVRVTASAEPAADR